MVHADGGGADDGDVPRPHLHRHDRHARRLQAPCAPAMSTRSWAEGAPRLLVRRHQGRQDPGTAQPPPVTRAGRRRVRPSLRGQDRHEDSCDRLARWPRCAAARMAKIPRPCWTTRQGQGRGSRRQAAWSAKVDAYQLCKAQDQGGGQATAARPRMAAAAASRAVAARRNAGGAGDRRSAPAVIPPAWTRPLRLTPPEATSRSRPPAPTRRPARRRPPSTRATCGLHTKPHAQAVETLAAPDGTRSAALTRQVSRSSTSTAWREHHVGFPRSAI